MIKLYELMSKGYFGPFIKTVQIIQKESSPSLDMPYCMAKRTKNYLEKVCTDHILFTKKGSFTLNSMYPILPLNFRQNYWIICSLFSMQFLYNINLS